MAASDPYSELVDELAAHILPQAPSPAPKPEPGGVTATSEAESFSGGTHLPSGAPRPPHETQRVVYLTLRVARPLEELGGWLGAIREGAVSIACLWRSEDEAPRFYTQETVDDLVRDLREADVVVTFNGRAFDLRLLEAHTHFGIPLKRHFDLFQAVQEACERAGVDWKGQGLGALGRSTLQRDRSGEASDAPRLYQAGKWGELVNGCLHDTLLLRDLVTFTRREGWLSDKDGLPLPINVPEALSLRPST